MDRSWGMAARYDYMHAERKEKILRILIRTAVWIISFGAAVLLGWFLIKYSLMKTTVPDASMEPNLTLGDEILINTLSYRISSPKRFDVIVFNQGDEEHSFYNIKRIIGLPGETVQISGGYVKINGELLTEPYNFDAIMLPGLANYEITLGEDEYFVLGDSRNNSEDSRYSTVGNVRRDEIIGKAWIRLNNFGFVSGFGKASDEEEE